MTSRRNLRRWALGFSGCMFAVAGLAPLIRPLPWLVWIALILLGAALACLAKVATILRREEQ